MASNPPSNGQPPDRPPNFMTPRAVAADPDGAFQAEVARALEGIELEALMDADRPEETDAVRGDQVLPGEMPPEQLDVSQETKDQFVRELLDMLDLYDASMEERWQREEEIEAAYALAAEPLHGGTAADSELLTSEFLMAQVDQAAARIEENLVGARPLIKIDPIVREGTEEDIKFVKRRARSTENFINSFAMHDVGLEAKIPLIALRTCKVGTTVIHQHWRRKYINSRYWGTDGQPGMSSKRVGTVEWVMPPNRHVIVWPPNREHWQECAVVGHRFFMTKAEARTWLKGELRIDDLTYDEIMSRQPDQDQAQKAKTANQTGIDQSDELDRMVGQLKFTQLYWSLILPGENEPRNGYCILHEDTRKLLLIDKNRYWHQRIPYFPIRYKLLDDQAWGMGVGDEVIYIQAQDSALRNLQMDNLMSGAFNLVQVKAGTMADVTTDRLMPGQVVATDAPGEDILVTPMGGQAEGVDESIQMNRFFGREATGLAPVLGGQGDPTMKSGAGTGSTLALIEQAGKKFGSVDRRMRLDLSRAFEFMLELVTQYGQEGLYYRYASNEDADLLTLYRYEPLRGSQHDQLRIYASAPNAATSREGRQQALMVFWQFFNQNMQLMFQLGEPIYGQINPAGWRRYQERMLRFVDQMVHSIANEQSVPGLASMMPKLPDEQPQDEVMNALIQKVQQLQQQLEKAQMQMQQMMMGPGAPGGAPPGSPPSPMPPPGGMR